MGIPRNILPATPRAAAEYAVNFGWETAALRGASPYLLNVNGNPYGNPAQVGYPSVYQGLPTTASVLRQWLGSPVGWADANIQAIYNLTTASPLTDYLALGPNLAAGGGPLTGRECVGLGGTSFTSDVGVETAAAASQFIPAVGNEAFADANNSIVSMLAVFRLNSASPGGRLLGKRLAAQPTWYSFAWGALAANLLSVEVQGAGYVSASVAGVIADDAWHCGAFTVDDVAKVGKIDSDVGAATTAAYAGSASALGTLFSVGAESVFTSAYFQLAYLAICNLEITAAMRAAFWRHAQLPVPFLHARLNPLITPIGASRIACWSGGNIGQPAIGYDASLVSAALGNGLGSGYCMEDGITWLGLGTTAQTGWVGTNATNTPTDGPSSMRDSMRVADADVVNAGYVTSGSANLAGATAVPFQFAAWRQAVAGGGTNCVYRAYFTGDGGGPEELTWATDAGTVPAAWGRITGNCTPVGNAHTAVVIRIYPTDAVAGSTGTVDVCVEGGVQNRNFDWLAHRRCAAGATSATTTPAITVVNTRNYVYNPLRGRQQITIGNFQGTSGAVFLGFGLAGTAGSMMLSYNAGQLILRIWDNAAALVASINCGAVNTARHVYDVVWDSMIGYFAVLEGGTVLGSFTGPWTPGVADVTPLGFGCDNAGANAARCYLEAA